MPCGAVCKRPSRSREGPAAAHLHADLDSVKWNESGVREAGADGSARRKAPVDTTNFEKEVVEEEEEKDLPSRFDSFSIGARLETFPRGPKGVEMLLPRRDFSTKEKRLEEGSYSTRTCASR